ncbi:MAG: DUF4097 family beta strand repeat protein [Gemmatimonadales bacterium]|nr:DUF4097 family beta strand repeat protein [Gemmatimonadales bacterium]
MNVRLLLLPLFLAGPLLAQQKVNRIIAIDSNASIRITNNAGTIRLIAWDKDSLAVIGSLAPGASLYFGGKGAFAKLGVERRDETQAGPGSIIEVRLPRAVRVFVRSISAGVEVSGLVGELQCASVSGPIVVDAGLRLLVAESMEGELSVAGEIKVARLNGGAGAVTLKNLSGDVMATTVGGGITATGIHTSRARLETVSGPISYDGTVGDHGTLEAVTHSGDVTLRLPALLSAEFELQTFEGVIDVGLFLKGKAMKPVSGAKPYGFTTGSGGSQVTIRSFKGNIRVLRQ